MRTFGFGNLAVEDAISIPQGIRSEITRYCDGIYLNLHFIISFALCFLPLDPNTLPFITYSLNRHKCIHP